MLPKYFRLYDPSGTCKLAGTKRIYQATEGLMCPCGTPACPSKRENVDFVTGITRGYASLIYGILGTLAAIWLLLTLWGGENKLETALDELGIKASDLDTQIQRLEQNAVPRLSPGLQDLQLETLQNYAQRLSEDTSKALASKDRSAIETTKQDVDLHLQTLEALLAAPSSISTSGENVVLVTRLTQEAADLKLEAKKTLESLFTKHPSDIPRAETFQASLNSLQNRIQRFDAPSSGEGTSAPTQDQIALESLAKDMRALQQRLSSP